MGSEGMGDYVPVRLPATLIEALAVEAERLGMDVNALAEEAIAGYLEACATRAHFESLRAHADWGLLDRVLSRPGDDPLS